MSKSQPTTSFAGVESAFLSGKVVKWTLPAHQPPIPPGGSVLKRLLLPQGELAQVHDGVEAMHYIACLELLPRTVRGNHYHKLKREYLYLMRGDLSVIVRDVETGGRGTVRLRAGELLRIETGVAHAMVIAEPGIALEFSPAVFNPDDTYRYVCAEV